MPSGTTGNVSVSVEVIDKSGNKASDSTTVSISVPTI
jgi:hypothetical protein